MLIYNKTYDNKLSLKRRYVFFWLIKYDSQITKK